MAFHAKIISHPSFESGLILKPLNISPRGEQLSLPFSMRKAPEWLTEDTVVNRFHANIEDTSNIGHLFAEEAAPEISGKINPLVESVFGAAEKVAGLGRFFNKKTAIGAGIVGLLAAKKYFGQKHSDYSDVSMFGIRFSGKDDNYNTIEGLKHGGMAQKKRREMTDFGSGWRRLFGGIKNVGNITAEHFNSLMDKKATWANQADKLLNLPFVGKFLGDVATGIREGAWTYFLPGLKPTVVLNKPNMMQVAAHYGLNKLEAERIMPVIRMHELSEAQHGPLLLKHFVNKNPTASILDQTNYLKERTISSHYSMAVIGDEALAAASLGSETFAAMKKFRYSEISKVGDYDYEKRTKKIYESVEKKWLPKLAQKNAAIAAIPGRDDAYNTISGLLHGGFAQAMRKKFTPFGSGWDPLRNLVAEHLGQGQEIFQNFTRSKGFQEALSKGKIVKELGAGAFGEAHLMETTINLGGKEHPFQYVRKTPLQTRPDKVIAEVKAMHTMSDLNAPNVYGVNKEYQVFMEHFKGELAHKIMNRGGTIPESAIDDLEQFFNKTHERGYAHLDAIRDVSRFHPQLAEEGLYADQVTPYNVIITPEGRAGVFDWGQATKASTKPKSGFLATAEEEKVKMSMSGYVGKQLETAADLDRELIAGLRRQKGKLSDQFVFADPETISNTGKSASTAATNKGDIPKPHAKTQESSMRKLGMAATQKKAVAGLFRDATFGGSRSKSNFVSARK
jgi:hypothetical protein